MKLNIKICVMMAVAFSKPAFADPPAQGSNQVPPVCATMPERLGHYWDQYDWCLWMQNFENNRDFVDTFKDPKRGK